VLSTIGRVWPWANLNLPALMARMKGRAAIPDLVPKISEMISPPLSTMRPKWLSGVAMNSVPYCAACTGAGAHPLIGGFNLEVQRDATTA